MNTVRSVGYGWFILVAAGGGAYYFAKRSINADRDARHTMDMERKAKLQAQYREDEMRQQFRGASKGPGGNGGEGTANPSQESMDPAPTRHAPETEAQRVGEKSKFEASEVWRSKKGDRLSGFK